MYISGRWHSEILNYGKKCWEINVVIFHMKYCITCRVFIIYIYIIIFAAAVKSQQTITCFVAANCDTNQPSQTIQSSDAVGECCNYPSPGVNPRGFAYVGQGTCTDCPKSMLSIDTSCSNYLLEMLSICNVTRSSLSRFIWQGYSDGNHCYPCAQVGRVK